MHQINGVKSAKTANSKEYYALVAPKYAPGTGSFEGIEFGHLTRSRGVKKRSRTNPTWFSTCPFSQPDAGVQASGSTR